MSAFNLTAEINLRGPTNIKQVVGDIKRQLSNIQSNVNIKISDKAAKNISSITNSVNTLNDAIIKAQSAANGLSSTLSSVGGSTSNISKNFDSVSQSVSTVISSTDAVSSSFSKATSEVAEFGKQSALAVRRFAAFSIGAGAIYGLTRAFSSAYNEFVAFDRQLIKLKQTTGNFGQDIDSISNEITRLSTTLGVSSSDLLEVSVTLAQAGLSASETKNALEALAKTTLSPSFEDITQTTEGAIAALRQFGLTTKDLEGSLGSINAVAAAFAVESSDIIAAIQRTGGVFASASKGVSQGKDALNEFIAVFTSVRATTRESAETIATGLRTIFTRIQRGSTIEALREYGVELTDLKGKFVGPYEAVRRLSEGLKNLDTRDIRFSKITEELGGFRQIGKVIPLIQQFATAQEALGIAQQGQSSLTTNAIQAQQALAVQFAQTRQEFLALVRAFGESDTFKNIVSYGLSLTRVLIQIAGAFKPIMPYLAIIGGIKGGAALTQYVGGFLGGLQKTTQKTTKTTASDDDLLSSLFGSSQQRTRADSDVTNRLESLLSDNSSALSNVTNALSSLERTIAAKGQTLNKGGKVMAFASGGYVPGSGNRDTVPAILTPGEFVIRKKAVETLGAGNLQNINKYATGGKVKKFAWGGKVSDLADIYSSINNAYGYDDVKNDRIVDRSTDEKISPSEISSRDKQYWKQSTSLQPWEKFEKLLERTKGVGPSAAGRGKKWALLDFPNTRSEAKFMNYGSTYSDPDSLKGNNPETLAAKNYLFEQSIIGNPGNRANMGVEELEKMSNLPPAKVYWADPSAFKAEGLYNYGGKVKKFALGGLAQSIGGIESSLLEDFNFEELKQTQSNDIEELLDLITLLGGNEKTRNLSGIQSVNIGARRVQSGDILSANKLRSPKNSEFIPYARDIINAAIPVYNQKQKDLIAQKTAMGAANKFQMATLLPFDANKTIQSMIGGKATSILAKGVPSQNKDIVEKLQEDLSTASTKAAEAFQMRKIFGTQENPNVPLVFDFDETLIENLSDVMKRPDGRIDIEGFNDLPRVKKGLEDIKLTRLGEVLRDKLNNKEISADDIRVVSARTQNNAPYMSQALSRLGLNIPSNKITGVSGAENKINNVTQLETLIDDRLATVEQFKQSGRKAIGYAPIVSDFENIKAVFAGQASMEGAAVEKILANLGAPLRADAEPGRPIDYPDGLGVASQYWDLDPNVPTEVKRELNSSAISRTKAEIARYYSENASKYMFGGIAKLFSRKQQNPIEEYKKILQSILPSSMLTNDGLLKTPSGAGEPITITQDTSDPAYYSGGLAYKALRHNLDKAKDSIPDREYKILKDYIDQNLSFQGQDDVIDIGGAKHKGVLAHETFHDIQGHLYDYYPEIIDNLFSSIDRKKEEISAWYNDPKSKKWTGKGNYKLSNLFPSAGDAPIPQGSSLSEEAREYYSKRSKSMSTPDTSFTISKSAYDLGRNETIPVLLGASSEGDSRASKILSGIFSESGLNSDFYKTLPRFFWGGKVDPLAKKYGLTQDEFTEQKQISEMMGLDSSGLKERLKSTAARKKKGKDIKFGLLDTQAEFMASSTMRSEEQAALEEFLKQNKFAGGGEQKKTKQFGKIALRIGDRIQATYMKEGEAGSSRSGQVIADKIRNGLYSVQSSAATGGYGPKLYDIVMEAATAQGGMLTSDRRTVTDSAKSVWSYYFNNRGDVNKTPLDPIDWTSNNRLVDPKLYGKPETWPPRNDPAWILQTGYSKSPLDINNPDLVQKFAKGGSSSDTVPALLTPGEFVINKKVAQKIGYGQLNKLNKADKIQGFNKGGPVGIQSFAIGGKAAPGDYAVSVEKFVEQIVKLTSVVEQQTYNMERLSGRSVPEAKKEADSAAQTATIDRGRELTYLDPGSAQIIADAVGKVLESYVSKISPFVEGGPRQTSYGVASSGPIPNPSPPVDIRGLRQTRGLLDPNDILTTTNVIEKFTLLASASGKSFEQLSKEIKQFTTDSAISYKEMISQRQKLTAASISRAGDVGSAESKDVVGKQITELFDAYGSSLKPERLQEIIDETLSGIDEGLNVSQIKKRIPELDKILNDVISNGDALSYAIDKTVKKFGTLTSEMTPDELDIRAGESVRSGRFGAGNARALQAASEANPFWEKLGGNRFPGFDALNKTSPELAKRLGEITEKAGGFVAILGAGSAFLGNSLPKMYEGLDKLTGSVLATNEVAKGLGKALNQAGNDAIGMAKLAQQGGFGARGVGIAATIGAAGGAIGGFREGFISQSIENLNKTIATNQEKLTDLFSQLATQGLEAEDKEDIKARALREIGALSSSIGTVMDSTAQYWSTSIGNLVDAALYATNTFLTIAASLALIKAGSALTGSRGGSVRYYKNGDIVGTGPMFKPKGTDTVPAMLTPGEFVVNAQSAKKNRGLLETINSNRYMARGGVVYAAKGNWIKNDREAGRSSTGYAGTLSDFYNPFDQDFYKSSNDATEAVLKFGGRLAAVTAIVSASAAAVIGLGPAVGGFFTKTLPGLFSAGFKTATSVASGAWSKITGIFGVAKAAAGTATATTAGSFLTKVLATKFAVEIGGSVVGFFTKWLSSSSLNAQQQQTLLAQAQVLDRLIEYAKVSEIQSKSLAELKAIIAGGRGMVGPDKNRYFAEQSPILSAAQRVALQSGGFNVGTAQSIQGFVDSLNESDRARAKEIIDAAKLEQIRQAIIKDEKKVLELAGKSGEEAATRISQVLQPISEEEGFKTFEQATQAANQQGPESAIAKALQRGFDLLGPQAQSMILEDAFSRIAVKIQAEVDLVLSAMKKFEQGLNYTSESIGNIQNIIPTALGNTMGTDIPSVRLDRQDLIALKNLSVASTSQIETAVRRSGSQMGMTATGIDFFESQFKAQQVIENELPNIISQIVSQTASGQLEEDTATEQLQKKLEDSLSKVIDPEYAQELTRLLSSRLTKDNRQGGGFARFLDDTAGLNSIIKGVFQTTDGFIKANENAKSSLETLAQISAQYGDTLTRLIEIQTNSIKINRESAISLKRTLGEEVSLEELNKPFDDEIKSLTRGPGRAGTTDPVEIAKRLDQIEIERQNILTQLREGPKDLLEQGIPNQKAIEDRTKSLQIKLGLLGSESNRLNTALNTLATSTVKASNVLNKIQELRRIDQAKETNFMDLLKNINNPEYFMELEQSARAFGAVMSGQGNRSDIPNAIKAFEMRRTQMTPEQANEEGKVLVDAILKIEPALAGLLGPGGAFEGAFKTRNVEINNLTEEYNSLIAKTLEANTQIFNRMFEGSQTIYKNMTDGAREWYNSVKASIELENNITRQNELKRTNAELRNQEARDRKEIGGFNRGGVVYASDGKHINFQPRGSDTVPAMLTPGEFVVNKKATQKNLGLLKNINSGGNGYSKGGIAYLADGGLASGKDSSGSNTFDRMAQKGNSSYDFYGAIGAELDEKKKDLDEAKQFSHVSTGLFSAIEKERKSNYTMINDNNWFIAALGGMGLSIEKWGRGVSGLFTGTLGSLEALDVCSTGLFFGSVERAKAKAYRSLGFTAWANSSDDSADMILATTEASTISLLESAIAGYQDVLNYGKVAFAPNLATDINDPNTWKSALGKQREKDNKNIEREFGTTIAKAQRIANFVQDISAPMAVGMGTGVDPVGNLFQAASKGIVAGGMVRQAGGKTLVNAGARRLGYSMMIPESSVPIVTENLLAAAESSGYKLVHGTAGPSVRQALSETGELPFWANPSAKVRFVGNAQVTAAGEVAEGVGDINRVVNGVTAGHQGNAAYLSFIGENANKLGGIEDVIRYSLEAAKKNNQVAVVTGHNFNPGYSIDDFISILGDVPKNKLNLIDDVGRNFGVTESSLISATTAADKTRLIAEALENRRFFELQAAASKSGSTVTIDTLKSIGNEVGSQIRGSMVDKGIIGSQASVASIRPGVNPLSTLSKGTNIATYSTEAVDLGFGNAFELANYTPSFKQLEETYSIVDKIKKTAHAVATTHVVNQISEAYNHKSGNNNHGTKLDPTYRRTGGVVYASDGKHINFQPRGSDTVPAMLTPGEFVVNKKATQNNLPLLQSMNSGYYNKGGKVRYLANGGSVAGMSTSGGVSNISIETSSLDSAFKSFGDHVSNMKKNIDSFAQSIGDIKLIGDAARTLSVAAASIRNASDNFGGNIRQLNTTLISLEKSINDIPRSISLQVTGAIPVNVNVDVNGGDGLDQSLEPFKETIYREITRAISDATQGNLNINLKTMKK